MSRFFRRFRRKSSKSSFELPEDFEEWVSVLRQHKVAEIPPQFDHIIEIDADANPVAAFRVLLDHHIQAAPVFDSKAGKYVGFLSIRQLADVPELLDIPTGDSRTITEEELLSLWLNEHSGVTTRYLAQKTPFRPVRMNASLVEAAATLGTGVHRCPVVNDEGRCVNLISQLSLVKIFFRYLDQLTLASSMALCDLGIGTPEVRTVSATDSAKRVFSLMSQLNLGSVPIVDHQGRMVGKTSSHDLEIFLHKPMSMHKPILQFLAQIRAQDYPKKSPHQKFTIVGDCRMTLETAIRQLATASRHHIMMMNGSGQPIRVISVGDIVRYATRHAGWREFEQLRLQEEALLKPAGSDAVKSATEQKDVAAAAAADALPAIRE
ncbi:MAG: hypothetical protein MHM6MM_008153 [Cercozoa sp. M6MM]